MRLWYNDVRKRKGKAGGIVKDKLYTLMVTTVTIGATLLVGWGVLVILGKLLTVIG